MGKFSPILDLPALAACPKCGKQFPYDPEPGEHGTWLAVIAPHSKVTTSWGTREKCDGSFAEVEVVPVTVEKMQRRLI